MTKRARKPEKDGRVTRQEVSDYFRLGKMPRKSCLWGILDPRHIVDMADFEDLDWSVHACWGSAKRVRLWIKVGGHEGIWKMRQAGLTPKDGSAYGVG